MKIGITCYPTYGGSGAVERFSSDRIVPQYERLYEDVVSGAFGDE